MNQSLVPANTNDVKEIATSLAASGFFKDATSAQQAFAKVLAGAELGLPAFQSMSGIHIVQGKPQLGAGLIAALIKRSTRYNYRVTMHTDEACEIQFYEKFGDKWEVVGNAGMTLKQAKEAGLTTEWDRTNNKWKDKVTWKNFPKNMLFARCMSNGAKWYCPDVFGGPVYTEGELDEPVIIDTTAEVVESQKPKREPYSKTYTTQAPEVAIVQVVEEVVKEKPKAAPAPVELTQQEIDAMYAALDLLNERADNANTPDEFQKIRNDLGGKTFSRMPIDEKKKVLSVICEIAAEKGIDYDLTNKAFFERETGGVATEIQA